MFRTRLISGIILVILALVTILCGGGVLAVTLFLVSLAGVRELYQAVGVEDGRFSIMAWIGYIGCGVYYLVLFLGYDRFYLPTGVMVLTALMFAYVFCWPRYDSNQAMSAVFGFFYVAVMLSFVYQTRMLEDGKFLVWLIFLCSWGCDTCAYCVAC